MKQESVNVARGPNRLWVLARALGLLLCAVICLVWSAVFVIKLTPPFERLNDFVQEWTSARNYLAGEPIYAPLSESMPRHLDERYRDYVVPIDVNGHPPTTVLVTVPLARLSFDRAYVLWNVVWLSTLPVTLWLLVRRNGLGFSAWSLLPIATLILTSNSLAQQVNEGQLNLLLVLLITAAWAAWRANRSVWAGSLIGAAAAVKIFPAFLFLYPAMRRDGRSLLAGALTMAGLTLVTGAVLGWDSYRDYFMEVVPQLNTFREYWPNASLSGYFHKLFGGQSGHVIPLVHSPLLAIASSLLTSLFVVGLAAWKGLQASSPAERDVAFTVIIVAMLLVSPITWDHYFLLLIPAFAILWKRLPSAWSTRGLLLVLALVLGTIYPKWIWDAVIAGDGELAVGPGTIPSVAMPWHALTVISYQFYGLLTLFLLAFFQPPVEPSHGAVPGIPCRPDGAGIQGHSEVARIVGRPEGAGISVSS